RLRRRFGEDTTGGRKGRIAEWSPAADSILPGLTTHPAKKKHGDDSASPVPTADTRHAIRGRRMLDALRMNVTVVALLAAASAINGFMFYQYL
ncbi:MAG: hypothetical protein ABWY14_09685, partial [Tardiphaga sp.]